MNILRPHRQARLTTARSPRDGRAGRNRPSLEALESRALLAAAITEIPLPSSPLPNPIATLPGAIAVSADGAAWFAEADGHAVGRVGADGQVKEFPVADSVTGVAVAHDGSVVVIGQSGKLAKVSADGTLTTIGHSTANLAVTAGPDGNVWLGGQAGALSKITPQGKETQISTPGAQFAFQTTTGPDGNLWFTTGQNAGVGRVTTSGDVKLFPTPGAQPKAIVSGPDGNLWFTDQLGQIGRISTSGATHLFPLATPGARPEGLAFGPDGNLWFTEDLANGGGKLARMTPDGQVTEFPLPSPAQQVYGLTAAPDGSLWFVEDGLAGGKIARATLAGADRAVGGQAALVPSTEGQAFSGPVAVFSTSIPTATAATFAATIDWGDGSAPTAGKVVAGPNGSYVVTGDHTYAAQGSYRTRVAVLAEGSTAPVSLYGTANVTRAPLVFQGLDPAFAAGQERNVALARSTQLKPDQGLSATVDWGDGSSTDKVPVLIDHSENLGSPLGMPIILATHRYASPGSYPVRATIDDGGVTSQAVTTATVYAPIQGLTLSPPTATSGVPFQGPVAHFTWPAPNAPASRVLAYVNWGDGSSTDVGAVTADGQGGYTVSGSHTYMKTGTTPIAVQVYAPGQSVDAKGSARVVDRTPIQNLTLLAPSGTEATPLAAGTPLARFDASAFAGSGDYTATVDWNDGTPPAPAQVVIAPGSTSAVVIGGGHSYGLSGSYPIRVAVRSASGDAQAVSGQVQVNPSGLPPALSPKGLDLSATSSLTFGPTNVASFLSDASAKATDFTTVIDWGDGNRSLGNVTTAPYSGNGVAPGSTASQVTVGGSHTYAAPGSYAVQTTIVDRAGNVATATGTAKVVAGPIYASGFLNPASDRGTSQSDGITNDATPEFLGTASPGSLIRLFALTPGSNAAPMPIGQTQADALGAWRITTTTLADGTYSILGAASDASGHATMFTPLLPSGHAGPLVIDTVAPVAWVTGFDAAHGTVSLLVSDDRAGLDTSHLAAPQSYSLTTTARGLTRNLPLTDFSGPSPVGGSSATTPQSVAVSFALGRHARSTRYQFRLLASAVTDAAGNALATDVVANLGGPPPRAGRLRR